MAVVVKLFNNLEITMILSQFFQYLIIADSYLSFPSNLRASKSPFYAGIWHIELRDGINLMSPRNHLRQIPLIINKLSQKVTRDVCHENPGNCRAPHYLLNVSVSRLPELHKKSRGTGPARSFSICLEVCLGMLLAMLS